jgi:hypothetical protein
MFALNTPYHGPDWERLRKELKAERVRCIDAGSSLGGRWLNVEGHDFVRARRIAEKLINRSSLTIRLSKDADGRVFEVYENGKKIREESYVCERIDKLACCRLIGDKK